MGYALPSGPSDRLSTIHFEITGRNLTPADQVKITQVLQGKVSNVYFRLELTPPIVAVQRPIPNSVEAMNQWVASIKARLEQAVPGVSFDRRPLR